MCMFLYLPGAYIIVNFKSYILSRINDDHLTTFIATTSCCLIIIGRFLSGLFFDKFKIITLLRVFLILIFVGHLIIN
jgi:hypothetical protein